MATFYVSKTTAYASLRPWKEADPGIVEVEDAEKKVAELKELLRRLEAKDPKVLAWLPWIEKTIESN